jgi:hypothetical protein
MQLHLLARLTEKRRVIRDDQKFKEISAISHFNPYLYANNGNKDEV